MKTLHEPSFYPNGYGSSIQMDKETGEETFVHGQVVLVKDHINWQWTQRAFAGFGQNGIITTYATANKAEGQTVGWCHFHKEDAPTVRRLSHLPEIGETLYIRHIYSEAYCEKRRKEEQEKYPRNCTIVIVSPEEVLEKGKLCEKDRAGLALAIRHDKEDVAKGYHASCIRHYRITECVELPEWEDTYESCIMQFHVDGSRDRPDWNVNICQEV